MARIVAHNPLALGYSLWGQVHDNISRCWVVSHGKYDHQLERGEYSLPFWQPLMRVLNVAVATLKAPSLVPGPVMARD